MYEENAIQIHAPLKRTVLEYKISKNEAQTKKISAHKDERRQTILTHTHRQI